MATAMESEIGFGFVGVSFLILCLVNNQNVQGKLFFGGEIIGTCKGNKPANGSANEPTIDHAPR